MLLGFCLTVWAASPEEQAQEALEADRQRQADALEERQEEDRQETLERQLEKRQPVEQDNLTEPEEHKKDTRCFPIQKILFDGVTVLNEQEQAAIVQPFMNRCLTLDQINKLIKSATKAYLDKGFVTSKVGIAVGSNLHSGTLTLVAAEGKVDEITLDANHESQANLMKKKHTSFPIQYGDLLNLYAIEQGLDNINRLRSQKGEMSIQPAQKQGHSTIDVKIKDTGKAPHRLWVETNNTGSDATGKYPITIGLSLEDLGHDNGTINMTYKNSSKRSEFNDVENLSRAVTFGLTLPNEWWLYSYNLAYSDFSQQLKTENGIEVFTSHGNSIKNTFDASRVMFRDKKRKLSLGWAFVLTDKTDYINDALIEVSSRTTSDIELYITYLHFLPRGYLSIRTTFAKGTNWFGATEDTDTSVQTPRIQFHRLKNTLHYSYSIPTKNAIEYKLDITAQAADSELLSAQSCSVGGHGSVGGFTNSVSEETCLIIRNALKHNPLAWHTSTLNAYTRPFSFSLLFDYGRAESYHGGESYGLVGSGFAIQYKNEYIDFAWYWGKALSVPKELDNQLIYPNQDNTSNYLILKLMYPFD